LLFFSWWTYFRKIVSFSLGAPGAACKRVGCSCMLRLITLWKKQEIEGRTLAPLYDNNKKGLRHSFFFFLLNFLSHSQKTISERFTT
jgi:hypothetical protein